MTSLRLGLALLFLPVPASSQMEVHLEELWEIGAVNGPEHATWQQISDVVASDDHVYVLDNGLRTLRQFTISGEYVRELGRVGQGPGEFSGPASIEPVEAGVQLFDVFARRCIEFDSAGRHISTQPFPDYPGPLAPSRVIMLRHGWALSELPTYGNQFDDYVTLFAIWRGEEADTIVVSRALMTLFEIRPGVRRPLPPNTGPDQSVIAVGDSLVMVINGNRSEATGYRILEAGAVTLGTWSLPGSSRVVEGRERDVLRRLVEERRGSAEGSSLPDRWPAWVGIDDGGDGVVWVKQGGVQNLPEIGPAEVWLRWQVGTEGFARLEVPSGVRLLDMQGSVAVGARHDDLDVPYLVAFRVVER
ncbi:MAG: 6-bladed beta-propeller [Gemmatimonadetes bacterium]|nr:6-bladed beta-propeller [Gemmatimonadota bacterium]NNM06326.1 6-bladed beta-propeller [Gemmatimonadota bacterium]